MVDLPFGQEGGKLLPDGLDEVWWERGHGRTPSSGSLENSPHDRAACARLSSRLIVSLSAQGLSRQPVEKVVVGPVGSPEPHPNTWTSTPKHCNGGVFESLKDARNGPRGVFQQAAGFSEVRKVRWLREKAQPPMLGNSGKTGLRTRRGPDALAPGRRRRRGR